MPSYFKPGTYALVPNKHLLPQMKGAPLSVYITLCAHADDQGVCFPGIKRICDTTGYDRATVFRALTTLIELEVIERHNRTTSDGDPDSNLYRILLADYPQGSRTHATTPSHTRHGGSRTHATTGSRTDATLTNPSELTHLRKGINSGLGGKPQPPKPVAEVETPVKGDGKGYDRARQIAEQIKMRKLNKGPQAARTASTEPIPPSDGKNAQTRAVKARDAIKPASISQPANVGR